MGQSVHVAPGLDGLRILVVEDEYFIATDLQDTLEQRGASVIGPIAELALAHSVIHSNFSIMRR